MNIPTSTDVPGSRPRGSDVPEHRPVGAGRDGAGPPAGRRPAWLSAEVFPFESRFLALEGQTVHYVDEGTGPTLLFVHPGPLWSFVFRDVIERMRARFRCITLDFPGSGLSPATDWEECTRLDRAADLLAAFVERLGLEDLTLVLHDTGGPVGLAVAGRRPETLRALVLAGTFGWRLGDGRFPRVARMLRLVSGVGFSFLNWRLNLLALLSSSPWGAGRRLGAAGRRALRGPFRDRRRRDRATGLLGRILQQEQWLAEVERGIPRLVHLPVLLLYGENDPGRRAGFQHRFEALLPDAHSVVVPGGHHFPQADDPELFADAIEAWWDASVARDRSAGDPPGDAARPSWGHGAAPE